MRQRFSWRWLLLVMPILVATVIGIVYFPRRNTAVQVTTVPGPPGINAAPAWVADGLVVGYEASDCQHFFCFRLYYLKPDGSERRMLSLPDQSGCDRNGFESPARLPDGRLGYILRCGPAGEFRVVLYMMTYDLKTEQAEPLLSYPLPSPVLGTGGYSWNPGMTRGITSDGNGYTLYEQLYWIEPGRWEPLDVGFPQAYGASWSPDGQQIAFFGASEQGLKDIAWLDAVYNLYLMKPDGTDVRPLVEGFRYPDRLTWSPDSQWLAFSATFGNLIKQKGLWLIEVATGDRRLIVEGDYGWAAWSPEGQQLAVVDSSDYEEKRQSRLVIIEMAPLLKP